MRHFPVYVEFLVSISVVVTAISNYLIVNKLWKRRSKKEVAESISIAAALLGMGTGLPFFVQFAFIDQSPAPAVKTGIGLLTGLVFLAIGSGLWVRENRGRGLLPLLLGALNLERKESTYLLKELGRPTGAAEILAVLRRLAAVDRHVDETEMAMIEDFSERWGVEPSDLTTGTEEGGGDLMGLRDAVADYLAVRPPPEQAGELLDLLQVFVKADAKVTREEDMALEELSGLITAYVRDGDEPRQMHEVLIVPQSDPQFEAVRSLVPGTEVKTVRGGRVFSVGRFFSSRYAEAVCQKYIDLGLFTARVEG